MLKFGELPARIRPGFWHEIDTPPCRALKKPLRRDASRAAQAASVR